MCDDATELGGVALHLDERSAKRGFFLALGQRLFEQTPEAVLLTLNPEKILHLLARASARDLGFENGTPHDLVALQPARIRNRVQSRHVLVGHPYGQSVPQIAHTKIINIAIAVSRKNVASSARISRRR